MRVNKVITSTNIVLSDLNNIQCWRVRCTQCSKRFVVRQFIGHASSKNSGKNTLKPLSLIKPALPSSPASGSVKNTFLYSTDSSHWNCSRVRQCTSVYVSVRQCTSVYVSAPNRLHFVSLAVLIDVFLATRRLRRACAKKSVSGKYLPLTVRPAMTGPLQIRVKFPYASLVNSSKQTYWLTQQQENQRFNRSNCQEN